MKEPRIQYAKTSDGVSIAFYTVGEGMPLVWMPNPPFQHLLLNLQEPAFRNRVEWAAQRGQFIAYDARGCGLSDRDASKFSLDAYLLDLEAVVDGLELQRFALTGNFQSGPVAIAYAAQHPERVSHLVLNCAYARGADVYVSPQAQAFRALRDQDWTIYTETIAHAFLGWSSGEAAQQLASYFRECITQQGARATWAAVEAFDVTDLLSQVRSPTLVIHTGDPWVPVDLTRKVASRIPNASLVVLAVGQEAQPPDVDPFVEVIEEFLVESSAAASGVGPPPGAFRTVLFTDLVGHTEMMSRLGDDKGREVLREHEGITREVLKAHGGTEVKTMGDGFMASFGSVTRAVECAVALQRAMAEWNAGADRSLLRPGSGQASTSSGRTDTPPLQVRCGLNAGEPIEEEGDLFGATVILAARIAAKAEGGEILVADTVRGLCAGKGFLFADRGEFVAKGFEEPVRVYEVRWRE